MLNRARRHAQQATKTEPDQPAELRQMQRFGRVGGRHGTNSPGIGQKCRRDPETDNVGERIEFLAELAFHFHGAGDAAVQRIKSQAKPMATAALSKSVIFPSRVARIA